MRLTAFSLSFALFAATFAAKFPVRKISKHKQFHQRRSGTASISTYTPHVLASSSNAVPDSADLGTVNDMIYIADIELGDVVYHLQLDTGSSDLWIKGQTSPLPNSEQTSTTYNLTYGIGWAFGHISYSTVKFAGISIPSQAFLDVSSAQNPAITYGTSGIMGLGFTALSTIDALINKTGSSSGRSLLYNLFSDNLQEPNFIAFSLQRSTDLTDDVQGTFLIGELDPDYAAVNQTSPIPTFPETNPTRWNVLVEAILVGDTVITMASTVPNAPSNRAVALLDSGTSYSYAPPEVCDAIYRNVPGAQLDPQTGIWSVPCNVEMDVAVQIKGQVFPMHPLDAVPKSITNPGSCVGSFVSSDISAIAAGNFDMIIGDSFLRSVYSVYDFGDFDASGKMGNPYVKLLPLVDPNQASKDFAAARGSTARANITYNAANSTAAASGRTTVSLSDDITNTLNKITIFIPIMLAVLGLNALVILLLAIAAFIYLCRRRNATSARNRRTARRLTPLPLEAMSTHSFAPHEYLQHGSSQHVYQPVSMALSEDTFVPPSPAFHHDGGIRLKAQSFDDRPKSVA
ncbi:acid protease [Multifurca ochricompacta]|uniref:Acid protease n=1 Tax=Multifurca ochricompacta TaxID=376703 RepID=A0AAD4MDK6_9AGAM|nr:acid protease [Multifurca ochricompacta]